MHSSPNDHRQYRQITLANDLRVLLIEDPDASRSAAALSVHVGHFNDPPEREGLAHFLEHMLFLGTEKFPETDDFQSFISRHGGSNNAWTGTENTTYFFDIQHPHFQDAIDRFAQFFIAPLFSATAVDKERQSVDAEYKLKLLDDVRRIYQVQKETINPAHPFSKFSVGNIDTLADRENSNVRDDLIAFYKANYSARIMTLALISPLSLDELEALVEQHFHAIPSHKVLFSYANIPFVDNAQQQKRIFIEPIKDIKKLNLAFSIPNNPTDYRTKPHSYIAHLIGYEGSGSLMSLLKNIGWVNHLSAGGGISGSNFKEFTITVSLTDEGIEHTDDIVCYIFQAIRLVKEKGLDVWRYDEKRAVQDMAFRYQEPMRPIDTVSHLVRNLQHYQTEDTLMGDYMMSGYDHDKIASLFDYLVPSNMRLTLIAKGQNYDRITKWYDTPYSVSPISDEDCRRWTTTPVTKELTLPEKNPFISYTLSPLALEATPCDHPRLIEQKEGIDLWFLQDSHFRVPKGIIYLAIDSPHSVMNVSHIVKTRVCIEMLLEAINESAYAAEIAGLHYNFYPHQGGATLKLSGFNEKMPLLLDLVLNQFLQRDFNPTRFSVIQTQLLRAWNNALQNKPINRLHNLLIGHLQPNNPPYETLIEALLPLTVEELPQFVEQILAKIHINMLVYGNWHEQQAHELAEKIRNTLHVDRQKAAKSSRPLFLLNGKGNHVIAHPFQQEDSAILVYYQSKEVSPQVSATFSLAHHLMSSAFYNELRTKQQLGYVVGCNSIPLSQHAGLLFYVQSPSASTDKLRAAIDDFLNAFFMVLLELTEYQWQISKQGLIQKLQEPDANLRNRAQRFWIAINNGDDQFDRREHVIDAIKQRTRADMVRFVTETLKPRTADRIIVQSISSE